MNTVQAHVGLICQGGTHSVFLSNEGNIYVSGRNLHGQLGMFEPEMHVPKRIANIPQIRVISCGLYSTICIDMEGNLWGFGENNYGQLGLGEHDTRIMQPVKIRNLPPIQEVKCGMRHTLCISEDSSLWAFGSNGYSQLFVPRRPNVHKEIFPVKTEFSNIINIMAGTSCSFVQNMEGEILVCGDNGDGQLGLGKKSPILSYTNSQSTSKYCCYQLYMYYCITT